MEHKKLRHQAAGHDGPVTDTEERLLFKPTIPQEIEFYTAIQSRKEKSSSDLPLECWMPTFIGTLSQGVSKVQADVNFTVLKDDDVADTPLPTALNMDVQENREYVVLENLLYGYNSPNIIDIKLGKVLYDEEATKEKQERLQKVSDTTTSGSLGFRICGMKVNKNELMNTLEKDHFEEHEDDYIFINKQYGRTRKPENIVDAFKVYFSHGKLSASRRAQLVNIFNERLQFLYNTMLEEEVRMYSSSLLLIYEGDPARWEKMGDNDCMFRGGFIDSDSDDSIISSDEDIAPLSSMSLIDFAHSKVTKGMGYDENVVEGIEGLLRVFEKLRSVYI